MKFDTLQAFASGGKSALAKGPVALILAEDDVEVDSTIRHHIDAGFAKVVVFGDADLQISPPLAKQIVQVAHSMLADNALVDAINTAIKMAPGTWFYYCFNAEYLFYPFCEHRSVGEMVQFIVEERREAVLTYVVDLYANDLHVHQNAVSIDNAHLDRSGYYALARGTKGNGAAERQLDFFGGLRWRFEEHVPVPRRRIDRVALFKAKPGLVFQEDHTFNEAEYNTFACPWHNSLTAAICSFRTAKALKRNPGSTFDIDTFMWHNSTAFDWHSQQLLDLGLMEPGQWF